MEKFFDVQDGLYIMMSENEDYIAVGDVETGWEVRFGKNLAMYKSLYGFLGGEELDEESRRCVMGLALEWFGDTNTLWDKDYMLGKRELQKDYFRRIQENMRQNGATADDIAVIGSLVGEA